jgi:WD40 repeat protein
MARFGKETHDDIVALVYSRDGGLVISADTDGKVIGWDRKTGKKARAFSGTKGDEALAFALSPDGKQLAGAFGNEGTLVWDLATGKRRRAWDESCLGVGFLRGGLLCMGHGEFLWDSPAPRPVLLESVPRLGIESQDKCAIGGDVVVSWCASRLVAWDPLERKVLHTLKTKCEDGTLAIAGKLLVVAEASPHGGGQQLEVWDLETGKKRYAWKTPITDLAAAAMSPDGTRIAAAYTLSHDGDLTYHFALYDAATKKLVDLALDEKLAYGGSAIAWSPDGKHVALGTEAGLIYEVAVSR